MTDKQREDSYKRYKQWQDNKIRYQYECGAYAIIFVVALFFLLSHFKIISLAIVLASFYFLFDSLKKLYKTKQGMDNIKKLVIDMGATVEQSQNGGIIITMEKQKSSDVLDEIEKIACDNGLKLTSEVIKKEINTLNSNNKGNTMNKKIKWTDIGTVNKHGQKNNGRTGEKGTDNLQYLYQMECLKCGTKYKVNGSNIYECKCPKCLGGKAIE